MVFPIRKLSEWQFLLFKNTFLKETKKEKKNRNIKINTWSHKKRQHKKVIVLIILKLQLLKLRHEEDIVSPRRISEKVRMVQDEVHWRKMDTN